jgi:hypothetical protein
MLPAISPIAHPGFSSIDICFSWDLDRKKAGVPQGALLTSSRTAEKLNIRSPEGNGDEDLRA